MYIGNTVQNQGYAPQVAFFSGNASTTAFTLPSPVATTAQLIVSVANVVQNPGSAYTVSGNTITFSSAPPTGTNNIWVEYTSLITQVIAPSPGTVGSAQLQSGVALANLGYTPINKAGDTGVGTLALASNAGITFNNSGVITGASTTLNDYETGVYTPTLSFSVSGSVSYSLNSGSYTKIGNLVTVTAFFVLGSVSSPSGNTTLSLPFNTNSAYGYLGSGNCAPYSLATGAYAVTVENSGSNSFYIWNFANGTRSSIASYLTSSSQLHITLTYVATF